MSLSKPALYGYGQSTQTVPNWLQKCKSRFDQETQVHSFDHSQENGLKAALGVAPPMMFGKPQPLTLLDF